VEKDQREAVRLLLALVAVVSLALIALLLLGPEAVRIGGGMFAEGLGLRDAAVLAFLLTVGVLVLFAVVAGDGLLGEIQFMIAGFAGFFCVSWLLIAWLF
jgi:hypothetical protein